MPSINPDQASIEEFARQVPDGQSIVMINLLRYRDRAALDGERLTGRQCYERYEGAVLPLLVQVGGRVVWRGQPRLVVIGPSGESWDDAILVRYPSRSAFERMVNSPEYRAIMAFRTAALEDSRLIATTRAKSIGRLAWWLFRLSSRFRRK
jgi:uncharacterized protein (DUF1330 family)